MLGAEDTGDTVPTFLEFIAQGKGQRGRSTDLTVHALRGLLGAVFSPARAVSTPLQAATALHIRLNRDWVTIHWYHMLQGSQLHQLAALSPCVTHVVTGSGPSGPCSILTLDRRLLRLPPFNIYL